MSQPTTGILDLKTEMFARGIPTTCLSLLSSQHLMTPSSTPMSGSHKYQDHTSTHSD